MKLEKILKYIVYAGVFLLPFLPLIVASNILYFPFISGKNFAFRIIAEIIFAAWIILAVISPKYRLRFSKITCALLAFAAAVGLATIFSENPYKSFWSNFERMEGFISIAHFVAYFIVAGSVLKTEKTWNWFWHTSVGVSIFIALFSLFQYSGAIAINQGGVRVDATFGNAIYLAGYMIFTIFLLALLWRRNSAGGDRRFILGSISVGSLFFVLFYLYHYSFNIGQGGIGGTALFFSALLALGLSLFGLFGKKKISNIFWHSIFAVLIVLDAVIVLLTATRGALLGLLAGVGLTGLLFTVGALRSRERSQKIAGLAIIATSILLVGAFFLAKDSEYVKEHKVFGRIVSISWKNEDALTRFRIWDIAFQGIKERPILGWGPESFNFVFNKYYNPELYGREQWFDRTHNIFFDWFVMAGLVGILAYLSVYFGLFSILWRAPSAKNIFVRSDKVIITGLVGANFVHLLFAFDNVISYFTFFSLLAYVHSQTLGGEVEKKAVYFKGSKIIKYVAPMVVLTLLSGLYWLNVRPVVAGNLLIKALRRHEEGVTKNLEYFKKALDLNTFANSEILEQLSQVSEQVARADALDSQTKKAFYDTATTELKKHIEKVPNDIRYLLFNASMLSAFGNREEALVYFERAREISPRKQPILFEMGALYINLGNPQEGLEYFKEAYESEPSIFDSKLTYAVGAIYAGENQLADNLLISAFGHVLPEEERIILAYFNTGRYDRVIEIRENQIKKSPANGNLRLLVAGAYLQNGDVSKAIEAIQRAIALDLSLKEEGEFYLREIEKGNY
ncbi:MAG: O-antigen ligase family protein [bacterium]|nr:O-antigen ligase family protein [bacterium]